MNLNNTIEKYIEFQEKTKMENDAILDNDLFNGLSKLKQINSLLKRALQLEYCIIQDNLTAVLKDMYNMENRIKFEEIPVGFFISYEEFLLLMKNNLWDNITEFVALTEGIYYLAFRFKKICEHNVPKLKGFDPIGIRDVRNHLLEHPHKDFTFEERHNIDSDGVKLKITKIKRETTQITEKKESFIDKGLKINLFEFKEKLEIKLTEALN